MWGRYPSYNALAKAVINKELNVHDLSFEDLVKAQVALTNFNTLEDEKRALDRGVINDFIHDALCRQFELNQVSTATAAAAAAPMAANIATTTTTRSSFELSETTQTTETVVRAANTVNENNRGDDSYFADVSGESVADDENIAEEEDNNDIQVLGHFHWCHPPSQFGGGQWSEETNYFEQTEDEENIEEEDRFSHSSLSNFVSKSTGTHEW